MEALAPEAVEFLEGHVARIGVAVVDLRSRTAYLHGEEFFVLASVAKVPLMLATLERIEGEEREATEQEARLLDFMIRFSDNDAAETLWTMAGGDGAAARALVGDLGLSPANMAVENSHWGAIVATPYGLALLLAEIADGSMLSAETRAETLELMRWREGSWGVIAGFLEYADGGSLHRKNGWFLADDGWRVNSTGIVLDAMGQPRYTLAILTDQQASLEAGVATTEGIARAVHAAMAGR